jgi:hypothetical protein
MAMATTSSAISPPSTMPIHFKTLRMARLLLPVLRK